MTTTQHQTAIKLVLAWSIFYLAYILFALWASGIDETPRTTNDIVANISKIVFGVVQLGAAIQLRRHYTQWRFRISVALVPLSIIIFFLLPLGWWR